MNGIRAIWRKASSTLLTAACWGVLTGAAWAQEEETKGGGANSYVLSYMVVILCIALGLLVVCRSSRRRERAKPEQFGE